MVGAAWHQWVHNPAEYHPGQYHPTAASVSQASIWLLVFPSAVQGMYQEKWRRRHARVFSRHSSEKVYLLVQTERYFKGDWGLEGFSCLFIVTVSLERLLL